MTILMNLQSPKAGLLPLLANRQGLFSVPVADKRRVLIISTMRLVHSRLLKLAARSMILVLIVFIFPFPAVQTILADPTLVPNQNGGGGQDYPGNFAMLFRDLQNEGLLKSGPNQKALFLTSDSVVANGGEFLNGMDLVSEDDRDGQSRIPDESLDFALASLSDSNAALEFIDRATRVGGIAVFQVNNGQDYPKLLGILTKPSRYKIVYLRRFQSSLILAMRKMAIPRPDGANRRHLLDHPTATEKQRKAALDKLEPVLLEPPRAASRRSRQYLKRTKYLPDLTGDSLESYPRRVFIDVGLSERLGGSGTTWFEKHYPKRNLHFEVYKIETMVGEQERQDGSNKEDDQGDVVGVSEWLNKNVREEEYVVMKAEAEAVEEMMKSGVIRLVDELFMECKPRGRGEGNRRMGRAYWECLALYGRLRDEGVAVHQWWG